MSEADKLQQAMTHARLAGLSYVYDHDAGITRKRKGKTFAFYAAGGKAITDEGTVARCRKLAVPPAWKDVWICADPHGHIQATGIDARGRKQYRYHADWRTARDANKFHNMVTFGRALPALRRKVAKALTLDGLPREKVIAAIVRMLDDTGLRVGNDEYLASNETFGITTITKKHVELHGREIELDFLAKGSKEFKGSFEDALLAHVLHECGDLPGKRLFQYVDHDGHPHAIGSMDINHWLQEESGKHITAKDFRTWTACVLFAEAAMAQADGAFHLKPILKEVSSHLGNTPAILQKSYVHPNLIDLYRDGAFHQPPWAGTHKAALKGLRKPEALLLGWLETYYK